MARTLLTFIAVCLVQLTIAQDAPEWMVMRFGQDSAQELASDHPEKMAFYVALDQGYNVEDVAPKEVSTYPNALDVASKVQNAPALTIELILSDDFHPELYAFDRQKKENTWYRLGDTSYLVTLYSYDYVKAKFDSEQ